MAAVSKAPLTKVVGRVLLFHCTLEPEMKFEPTTLRVKAGPPCSLLLGDKAAMAGTGLGGGPVELPLPPPQLGVSTAEAIPRIVKKVEGIR
jgi:hypothetical protein